MSCQKTEFLSNFWEEISPFLDIKDRCKLKTALTRSEIKNDNFYSINNLEEGSSAEILDQKISSSIFFPDSINSQNHFQNDFFPSECQTSIAELDSHKPKFDFSSFWGKVEIMASSIPTEEKTDNFESSFDEFLIQEKLEQIRQTEKSKKEANKSFNTKKISRKSEIKIARKKTANLTDKNKKMANQEKKKNFFKKKTQFKIMRKNLNEVDVKISPFKKPQPIRRVGNQKFARYLRKISHPNTRESNTRKKTNKQFDNPQKSKKGKILLRKGQQKSLEFLIISKFQDFESRFKKMLFFGKVKYFITKTLDFIDRNIFKNEKINFSGSFIEKYIPRESKLYTETKTNHKIKFRRIKTQFLENETLFCLTEIKKKIILKKPELSENSGDVENLKLECLSQMILFASLEIFLEDLNIFSSKYAKIFCSSKNNWVSQDCKSKIGCWVYNFIKIDYLIQLYISKIGVKNFFNFERLSQLKPVLRVLEKFEIGKIMAKMGEENLQFLGKFNDYLYYQIERYSEYFPQSKKKLEKRKISDNLKILGKVISKFESLSGRQKEIIRKKERSVINFPEKKRFDLDYLIGVINQIY